MMLPLIPYPHEIEFTGGESCFDLSDFCIKYVKSNISNISEAYHLVIDKNKVTITGSSEAALFYGKITFYQLIDSVEKKVGIITVPNMILSDKPKYKWRGMHLDVSRHFMPVEFVLKFIDQMSRLKMNKFHWHLTDDQGWRIKIDKFPRLNEISSFRKNSDGQKYGGFYTKKEIRKVVSYAAKRFIEIIPEIEMPGHTKAVLAAYPELSCTGGPIDVSDEWGIFEDIFCAGNEKTFNFLFDVLDEVMELFPSDYIHIGGDEVPYTRWENCQNCQDRIKSENLCSEKQLQNYFINRIQSYLSQKNKKVIGWDEIFNDNISKSITVMAWQSEEIGLKAAEAGHKVIMCPTSYCYFDYYQAKENEPKAIGGFLPLEKVYQFEPAPEEISETTRNNIIGGQGNVWTEYMSTADHVEYMIFPRICAIAEKFWGVNTHLDFVSFKIRLEKYLDKLNSDRINYRKLD